MSDERLNRLRGAAWKEELVVVNVCWTGGGRIE